MLAAMTKPPIFIFFVAMFFRERGVIVGLVEKSAAPMTEMDVCVALCLDKHALLPVK
jgi:hypothetical protein